MIGLCGRGVGEIGHVADRKIAMVDHIEIESFQQSHQPRRAKRRGPHQCAALRRAHVDGGAKHRDAPCLFAR
jgi:hypothetical protein